jgi:hypothetical protein
MALEIRRIESTFEAWPAVPWAQTWLTAVTRPSLATYRDLARQRNVGSVDAWIWLFGSSLLSGLLISLGTALPGADRSFDQGLALAIPVFAVIAVLSWAIFAVCIQGVARFFKGGGTYQTLIHVFAAFNAPLMLLTAVVSLIPRSGLVLVAVYLYWLVLYSFAVRAAHEFSWIKAAGTVLLSLMLLGGAAFGLLLLAVSRLL